jgi:hypothetical protein
MSRRDASEHSDVEIRSPVCCAAGHRIIGNKALPGQGPRRSTTPVDQSSTASPAPRPPSAPRSTAPTAPARRSRSTLPIRAGRPRTRSRMRPIPTCGRSPARPPTSAPPSTRPAARSRSTPLVPVARRRPSSWTAATASRRSTARQPISAPPPPTATRSRSTRRHRTRRARRSPVMSTRGPVPRTT